MSLVSDFYLTLTTDPLLRRIFEKDVLKSHLRKACRVSECSGLLSVVFSFVTLHPSPPPLVPAKAPGK